MFTSETGRKAGSLSRRGSEKTTAAIRSAISGKLDVDLLFQQIATLPVQDQVHAKIKLLAYILPRLAAVDISVQDISVKDFMIMSSDDQDRYIKSLKN